MCVYIYTYLLIYYLTAFTVTKKKKKNPPEFRDNNISWITAWGKRKRLSGEKKEKANFVTPIEKKLKDT